MRVENPGAVAPSLSASDIHDSSWRSLTSWIVNQGIIP
jgi:hypothetical protein